MPLKDSQYLIQEIRPLNKYIASKMPIAAITKASAVEKECIAVQSKARNRSTNVLEVKSAKMMM